MKTLFQFIAILLAFSTVSNAQTSYYVSKTNGSNRNDGKTAATAMKNIQKALDAAAPGDIIHVAEGNYFGLLDCGNIEITKPVSILGGYSSDFSVRNVLQHRTMIQPTATSNGSQSGGGTIKLTSIVAPNAQVVIDGLIMDRGNSISYNAHGEGKPDGVESSMMNPIGMEGIGGPNMEEKVRTSETAMIYFNGYHGIVNNVNVVIRNCAFVNAPNYGILGMLKGCSLTVENCIFVNVRMASMDVRGADRNTLTQVNLRNNTILFTWSRLKDLADMGYGFRMIPGTSCTLENNIIGFSTFAGLDRTHIDSDKTREAKRHDVVNNNIFFLNRQTDLTLPGGGMFLRITVDQFDDVEQLAEVAGNKSLTDPSVFKGKIDEAYLNGFLNVTYKESLSSDPNSTANTFRQAMGMNMTGTMTSSASMFANRYNLAKALQLFGAVNGCGAQNIKN